MVLTEDVAKGNGFNKKLATDVQHAFIGIGMNPVRVSAFKLMVG